MARLTYEGYCRIRDQDDIVHAAVIHGDRTPGRTIFLNGRGCFEREEGPGPCVIVDRRTPLSCLMCLSVDDHG